MSSLLAETGFPASEKQFFSIFQIFLAVKSVFPSSGNVLFNEFLIPASGTDVLSSGNSIFFTQSFVEVFEIQGWQLF